MSATMTPAAEAARMIDSLGPEALAKAQAYTTGNHWLLLIGAIVSILIAWVMVRFKLLDRVADKVSGWKFAFSTIAVSAAFFAISDLLELPWTIYTDWQRQHAFGMSKQPLGDFMGQWAIGEAVSLVLGALFMWGIYSLIRKTGARWWLWGGGFTAIVVLLTLLAAPSLIEPLFNKYQPVPAGPVLTALEEIADDVGIPHDRIFMFDGSRQSERFTANVAGIGPTARIAISDVALKEATLAEVRAVTGHEAGHYKLGHVWRAAVIMPLLAMLFFFLLNRLFAPTARLLGSDATLGEPRGLPVLWWSARSWGC